MALRRAVRRCYSARFMQIINVLLAVSLVTAACSSDDPATVDAPVGSDPCAALAPSPNTIGETQMTTAYPTPAGGTVVDGTYYLSRFEIYPNATADANTRTNRLELRNGVITSVNRSNPDANEIRSGSSVAKRPLLSFHYHYLPAGTIAIPYTATATEVWLFDTTEPNVQIYAKQ